MGPKLYDYYFIGIFMGSIICKYEKQNHLLVLFLNQNISTHFVQVGDFGVRLGCPNGLTRPDPINKKNKMKGTVLGV